MKRQVISLVSVVALGATCAAPRSAPYEKAAKLADLEISRRAPWAKSQKSAHSIFYAYKGSLLRKLQARAPGRVFVLESYDPGSGLISGIIWSGADSLIYVVNGSKLDYQPSYPLSRLTRQAISDWAAQDCPDLKTETKYLHPQQFVVQAYGPDKEYKACVVTP